MSDPNGATVAPKWAQQVLIAILVATAVWLYLYRLDFLAPRWEEPRRTLVAYEMAYRGDYITPTVFSEVYTKKPPLQNWVIAALGGFSPDRITVYLARLLSVIAIFATALVLIWLARDQRLRWPGLAALIYLTSGIVVQYGRSGAIDPLFVLWTTSAFACFFVGYARDRAAMTWLVPQLFVGLGVLTKGLAPVFVYPPIAIFLLTERRSRPPLWMVLGGFALCSAIVTAWVLPFTLAQSAEVLSSTGANEVLIRTPMSRGWDAFLHNLVKFPIEMLTNVLPWSISLLALSSARARRFVRDAWRNEPLLRLSVWVVVWMFLVLWILPGARGRYALPAYACVALGLSVLVSRMGSVVRRAAWVWVAGCSTLAAAFVAYAFFVSQRTPEIALVPPLVMGGVVFSVALVAFARSDLPRSVVALGTLGAVYALVFATLHVPPGHLRMREEARDWQAMARRIEVDARAQGLDPKTVPVGCSPGTHQRVCYEFTRVLGRPLQRPRSYRGASYAVGHHSQSTFPEGRRTIEQAHGFELYFEERP